MSRLKMIFVFLMLCLSCIAGPTTPHIPTTDQWPYVAKFDPVIQVKVDAEFETWQKDVLKLAFNDWEKASNYKIKFDVIWDVPKPGPWRDEHMYDERGEIFLWHVRKVETARSLQEKWDNYLGLMVYSEDEKSGNVIIFDNTPDFRFYSVALHEIGHLIGLKHIESGPVVMNKYALGTCLSKSDVELLCSLYGCEPVSQCPTDFYEDEPNTATRTSSLLLSSLASPEQLPESPQECH